MMNRKLVDDMAVEFCMSLNTKLHRKKLAKALFNVEKNRCGKLELARLFHTVTFIGWT